MSEEERKFIVDRVKELLEAPSCCRELKVVAQGYLDALDTPGEKKAGETLLAELEEDVQDIDSVLALFTSEAGKTMFGEKAAAHLAKTAVKVKAAGGKTCFCPACAAGQAILDARELLFSE